MKIVSFNVNGIRARFHQVEKLINTQKFSYKLYLNKIPISMNLRKVLNQKNLSKVNYISNGDDYQILFTSSKNKRGIIKKIASKYRIKLTKIGSIQNLNTKSLLVDYKDKKLTIKNKGYFHKF